MKVFYHHLTFVDDILTEIDSYEIDQEEKSEIFDLVHRIMHQHSLNVILNHLPRQHHDQFLSRYHENPADEAHWELLRSEIKSDIEAAIRDQAEKIKKEILLEVKRSKRV